MLCAKSRELVILPEARKMPSGSGEADALMEARRLRVPRK
jgi:hypothetical protein